MKTAFFACSVLLLAPLAACSPSEDVRPWRASDHDTAKRSGQVSGSAAPGQEGATLVSLTWRQQCAQCHGMTGRGDGPQGRMMRVPDIGRAEWQDKVDDETIARVIRKGRNKMPAFDLPPAVVDGLVKHVRSLKHP
jgi:cytochrome c oxidase cbb3-type subunit 3